LVRLCNTDQSNRFVVRIEYDVVPGHYYRTAMLVKF